MSKTKHKRQTFSKKWLEDSVKKKYVSEYKADSSYLFCLVCQKKFPCESVYNHIALHESQNNIKPQGAQATLINLLCDANSTEKYDFILTKWISRE